MTKEYVEARILEAMTATTEDSEKDGFKGYFSIQRALDIIESFVFETIGWNKKNNCFSTSYTAPENYDIRLYPVLHNGAISPADVFTLEEAGEISQKILGKMVEKGILEYSKSGKGIRVKEVK